MVAPNRKDVPRMVSDIFCVYLYGVATTRVELESTSGIYSLCIGIYDLRHYLVLARFVGRCEHLLLVYSFLQ